MRILVGLLASNCLSLAPFWKYFSLIETIGPSIVLAAGVNGSIEHDLEVTADKTYPLAESSSGLVLRF